MHQIGYGGGADIDHCDALILNNLFVNNSAPNGGGINFSDTFTELSLKGHNNYPKVFSGGSISDSPNQLVPIVENNTIIFNNSTDFGGGINSTGVQSKIINSILWGNTAAVGPQLWGTTLVTYSDIEGGYQGTGNMAEDPMFDDTTFYCINQHSLCVDAGNPDPMYNDVEDPQNPGYALLPARNTLRNDMGYFGGPNSLWSEWDILLSVDNDETKTGIPAEFTLSQNYPNPFNPSTTINYGITKRTFVELRIYDILGREVELLVNEEQDAGYYELDFNASKLSSGIYLYQIKAGNFIETKKMILLK